MGSPKIPAPVAPPTQSAAQVQQAADDERTREADAMGRQDTILGGSNATQQNAGVPKLKSLLGG